MAFFKELIVRIKGDSSQLQSETKKAQKTVGDFNNVALKAGAGIAAMFSVGAVMSFASAVIRVRSEFEKYEAVLKTTLGSSKRAAESMQMLQKFAAGTPFQLNELTNSYVKLVNRGIKPSEDQLRSLGDLASSTGKSFDQLAEAMLDSMTGENERLKEFGITAKDAGSKVAFTFKGVTTEVDKTSTSISNYIIGLGKLQGVTGSMSTISETLGGKISNLRDAWDALLNSMGKDSNNTLSEAITTLTNLLNTLNKPVDQRGWFWQLIASPKKAFNQKQFAEMSAYIEGMNSSMGVRETATDDKKTTKEKGYLQTLKDEKEALEKKALTVTEKELPSVMAQINAKTQLIKKWEDLATAVKDYNKIAEKSYQNLQDAQEGGVSLISAAERAQFAAPFTPSKEGRPEVSAFVPSANYPSLDQSKYLPKKKPEIMSGKPAENVITPEYIANLQLAAELWEKTYEEMVKVDAFTDTLVNSLSQLGNTLAQGGEDWKDFGDKALSALKDMVAGLIAQGVAAQVAKAMVDLPIGIGIAVGAVAGGLAAGVFSTALNQLPSFADGGMVNGPTLALVGDNPGRKEMIIPSEMFGAMGGGELSARVTGEQLEFILNRRAMARNRT